MALKPPKSAKKEQTTDLTALSWACANHLDKHRRSIVLEWVKQLRSQLNLPTASNLPDPCFTALTYRALDLTFKKLIAALRDDRIHEVVPDLSANHHEVLDHSRSLVPLLIKLDTLGRLIRRSIVADLTLSTVPALYYMDRVMSTLSVESILLFGERRRHGLKRLTDQYREEAQASVSTLSSCPVGILVTDRGGYITHFNQVQELVSGKRAADVLGKRLYQDYAHHDAAEFREAFRRAIQFNQTAHFKRRRYQSSQGVQYLDIMLAPVRDAYGRTSGAVQILEDVTARVDLEQQLRQQNRALSVRLADLEEAYKYIGRINRQFASLVDINTTLSSKISLDKMLDFIVRSAAMLTRARLTTLRLLSGQSLDLVAQYGLNNPDVPRFRHVPVDQSVVGRVLKENRNLLIVDLDNDTQFCWRELKENLKLRQVVSVPLRSRGRTIGVLSIHLSEKRDFTSHEQNFLVALANQAALAIDLEKALSNLRNSRSRAHTTHEKHEHGRPVPRDLPHTPAPAQIALTLESDHDPIRYSQPQT
ncbi:MAG: GAF domain-containing protein [Parcubacteria group bacterium]